MIQSTNISTTSSLASTAALNASTIGSFDSASSLDSLGAMSSADEVKKVAEDIESVFVSLMLKEMRNTLDSENGGLFSGEGSDTFGSMFDMFMGQHLAASKPLGIGNAIEAYLAQRPT